MTHTPVSDLDIVKEIIRLEKIKNDLLEALELSLATLERVYPGAREPFSSVGGTISVIDKAIAKAKGE